MYAYKLQIIISLIQRILAYDGIQLVKEVGNTLCPYMNFCHTSASREINETSYSILSCLPCGCDDDCWELHTCCPDKEELIPHPEILPCKLSKVKEGFNGTEKLPSTTDLLHERAGANYRVVDSCPSSENNRTLKRKCEGIDRETLSDYIWVSDSTNGRIYQNIHCIRCHGVEHFWYWSVKTTCQEILEAAVNIEETLLSMDCGITNVVPKDKTTLVAKYQCYDFELEDNLYTGCNVSSLNLIGDLSKDFLTACNRST